MADTQEHNTQEHNTQANSAQRRNFEGRRRFSRRAHMSVDRGLIRINNLFGPKGPSRILISRSQWEKHVRFVTSGVMDRWIQNHDSDLYLRERDGDYNHSSNNRHHRETGSDTNVPSESPVNVTTSESVEQNE